MDVSRPFWLARLEKAWRSRSIAWLAGVRRAGKTTLARALPAATYVNCDLPSVQSRLEDPEAFLRGLPAAGTLVLDEVHQLANPSRLLKLAADEHPKLRVLATGSSTLAATDKFKDALTGRKAPIHLVPVLPEELEAFGVTDLRHRLLRGGLPPALLARELDSDFYSEWMDSFYARDIQELFRVEKRQPFIRLLELALSESGAMVDVTRWAGEVGLSRPTTVRYLDALETTHAVTAVRPFHRGGRQEIVAHPRVYGFDTGFVCHARGILDLRESDCGNLLENIVLEALQSLSTPKVHYWRTKKQAEVNFVVPVSRDRVDAIECTWKCAKFDPAHMRTFREDYPDGKNILVCSDPHLFNGGKSQGLGVVAIGVTEFRAWYAENRG